MSNTLKYVAVAIVAGALVTAGYLVKGPSIVKTVERLGAVSSPDIMSPYFSFGGVRSWGYHTKFDSAATTTLCSFQTPASTSTLVYAVARAQTATSTLLALEWGKDNTNRTATTTSLGYAIVASGKLWTAVASSTAGSFVGGDTMIDGKTVLPPSSYVVFKMGGSAIGPSLTGVCDVVIREAVFN